MVALHTNSKIITEQQARDAAKKVGEELDADVILYCGDIRPRGCWTLGQLLETLPRKAKNVLLFLTTLGGSADEAFRIARCIQNHYPSGKFMLLVGTWCKSAGTLLALGTNEIIMTDRAELGPLDVQVSKKDEIGERTSGLTPVQALNALQAETSVTFLGHFRDLTEEIGGLLSTRTITQIAAQLSVGCYKQIYEHVDPMMLAEFGRSTAVAKEYGARLCEGRSNLKRGAIDSLIAGYPSHEFVIDRREASSLFTNVRAPNDSENLLAAIHVPRCIEVILDENRTRPLIEILTGTEHHPVNSKANGERDDRRDSNPARRTTAPAGSDGKRNDSAGSPKPKA